MSTHSRPQPTAFGYPRDFGTNHFVYAVVSPRARGLSIGINLNPDKACNFGCVYCEVDRHLPPLATRLDVPAMAAELETTLTSVLNGSLRSRAPYSDLPDELVQLRHVALSGDGEPTLCSLFKEAVEATIHLRARARFPFFKMVLVTNGSGLHLPSVTEGIRLFTLQDEVWVKLDAGTQAYMNAVNAPDCDLDAVCQNLLRIARQRPITVQSLFANLSGNDPPTQEIEAYANRLLSLKNQGAQIQLVQIYSATRPSRNSRFTHLPLRSLSRIAQRVREVAGLRAEVF